MNRWRGPLVAGMVVAVAGLVPATQASAGVTGSVTASPTTIAPGENTTVTVSVTVTEGTLPGEVRAFINPVAGASGNVRFTNVSPPSGAPLFCTVPNIFQVSCTWADPAVGDTATFAITAAADLEASGEWSVSVDWADQQGVNQGGIAGDNGELITVTSEPPTTTTTTTPTTTTPPATTEPPTTTTTSVPPPSTSTTSTTTSTTSVPTAAATTTVVWSSANPSVVGQPVTFTATVTPAGAAAAFGLRRPGAVSQVPADGGAVTFSDGDTVLERCPSKAARRRSRRRRWLPGRTRSRRRSAVRPPPRRAAPRSSSR